MIEIKARVLGTNKVLILIHALCTMQYVVLICPATLPGGGINTFNILKKWWNDDDDDDDASG